MSDDGFAPPGYGEVDETVPPIMPAERRKSVRAPPNQAPRVGFVVAQMKDARPMPLEIAANSCQVNQPVHYTCGNA